MMNTAKIETKRGNGRAGRKLIQCPRCNGKGRLRGFEHVEGGVCFLCGGVGKASTVNFSKAWEFDGESLNWEGSGIGLRDLCRASRESLLSNAHYMYLGGGPNKSVASTPWSFAHLACFVLATGDANVEARAVAALAKLGGDVDTFRAVLEALRGYAAECRA